jgi:transcriptional regulator with XRE-family HTH domain
MTTDHAAVVRALVAEADRRAAAALNEKVNKGEALAQLLADREGFQYKPPSVRAWIRGDAMPPADVLLAVARSVGISIDELTSRTDGSQPQGTERLEALEGQVASLTDVVNRLQESVAEQRRAARLEWARRSAADTPPTQSTPTGRPAGRSPRP